MSKRTHDHSKYLTRKLRERRHVARTTMSLDKKEGAENREAFRMLFYIVVVAAIILLVSGGNGIMAWLHKL